MSIATIVTRGYGSFGSIGEVVERGYIAAVITISATSQQQLDDFAQTAAAFLRRQSVGHASRPNVSKRWYAGGRWYKDRSW